MASFKADWYEDDGLDTDPEFFTHEVAEWHDKDAFQETSLEFERSRECEALRQALDRCQGIASITKVICLDMDREDNESDAPSRVSAHSPDSITGTDDGESDAESVSPLHHVAHIPMPDDDSNDHDDEDFTIHIPDALLEHVAALQLARYVEARAGRTIALLSQGYPSQGAFETMLQERGFSINKALRDGLFSGVDENSLVIMLKPRPTFSLTFKPRPAMLITAAVWNFANPDLEEQVTFTRGRIRGAMFPQIHGMGREYLAIPWASECCALPERCDDTLHSARIYQHKRHAVIDEGKRPGRGSFRSPRRYHHRLWRPSRPMEKRCRPHPPS